MSRKASPSKRPPSPVFRIPFDGTARAALPSKEIAGSKAHNLMQMARHGLRVPPGFVLGTELCRSYLEHGRIALEGIEDVLSVELERLGSELGRRFGDAKRPLLVSVRSGAPVSMPGMMETVLNVGLTGVAVQGLIRMTGNPRLALDCRRRLIEQFAEVVHGVAPKPFEDLLAARLAADRLTHPHEIDTEGARQIVDGYLEVYETAVGKAVPDDPMQQLVETIEAVLKSWSSRRAESYRRLNQIGASPGTAVIVQAMVFGNSGPLSGSGVGFTRNPSDGSNSIYVDYLPNAQGEDVVAGRRNAFGIDDLQRRLPVVHQELIEGCTTLEKAFKDMQDFEFTVEDGRLYLLQTRAGKRTPLAALRIAHDFVAEKKITISVALTKLEGVDLDAIGIDEFILPDGAAPVARAVPASVGMVAGIAVMDPMRLKDMKQYGKPLILVREHAETADIGALEEADALVTARGARTSHAAVVARQLGKVCLVGCSSLSIDASGRSCRFGDAVVTEGDEISVDGTQGAIFRGALAVQRQKPTALLDEVSHWRRAAAS